MQQQLQEISETPDSAAPGPVEGEAATSPLATYTPAQRFALTRYAHFDMLRREALPVLQPGDWRARLIHKALYSAYLDCAESGVGEQARLFGTREVTRN